MSLTQCPILTVQGGQFHRGEKPLFAFPTYRLYPGDCWLLRGENGSGKSSLLRTLFLNSPNHGIGVDWQAGFLSKLSYLASPPALFAHLSVQENVIYHACLWGIWPLPQSRIAEVLSYFSLQAHQHQSVAQLSSGQRQRLALSLLRLDDRPVWLLDEPTAYLDQVQQARLWVMCQEHIKQGGSILFSHHGSAVDEREKLPLTGIIDIAQGQACIHHIH